MKLQIAERSDIEWINKAYDEVGFQHSHFDKEIIVIAEIDGKRAGLGRLVTIDKNNLELGGIYVFENFRGKGIAKEIVMFLLNLIKPFQTVYCIPFEHLIPFYEECGFIPCTHVEQAPKNILEKYRWCKEKYPQPTSLLKIESNSH